jgi:hypothetical protein
LGEEVKESSAPSMGLARSVSPCNCHTDANEEPMKFTMRLEEYVFAGVTQYSIYVDGTTITGTVAAQQTGKWAWFLRYPDGGIELALVQEYLYGRLSDARREAVLRCAVRKGHSLRQPEHHVDLTGIPKLVHLRR